MNPGDVVTHRLQTTHYLEGGHIVCARRDWFGAAIVTETVDGNHVVLHACTTRTEAELLAAAYAAARSHNTDTTEA